MPLGNRASLPWWMQFIDNNDIDEVQAQEDNIYSDDALGHESSVPESSECITEEWKKNSFSKNHQEAEASSESVNSMFDTKKVILDDDKKQDFGARNILNPYDDQNQIDGHIKVTSPSTYSYSDDDQSIRPRPYSDLNQDHPGQSDDDQSIKPRPRVNLEKLSTESLSRYCRNFNIEGIQSGSSREQMLDAVRQHFATQPPLDELEERKVITEFVRAAKRLEQSEGPKD